MKVPGWLAVVGVVVLFSPVLGQRVPKDQRPPRKPTAKEKRLAEEAAIREAEEDAEKLREAVKGERERLTKERAESAKYLPRDRYWNVGDKGFVGSRVGREAYTILQVVDEENLLVQRRYWGRGPSLRESGIADRSETIWVKTDTEGMVDGRQWNYDPKAAYKVTGTKKYETAGGGTKTVLVLEKLVEPEPEP
jgi:hypothetical protein